MNLKVKALVLTVYCGLVFCKRNNTSNEIDQHWFTDLIGLDTLRLNQYQFDSPVYGFKNTLIVNDSLLILENSSLDSTVFTIYDLKNNKTYCKLGILGKGKNELTPPFQISYISSEGGIFSIFERTNFQLKNFELNSLLDCSLTLSNSQTIKNQMVSQVYPINKNHNILLGYFKDRFVISNSNGDIIYSGLNYPYQEAIEQDFGENFLYYIFQGKIKFHPEESLFVWADRKTKNILIGKFTNSNIEIIKEIYFDYPNFKRNELSNFASGEFEASSKLGYVDFCTSDTGIHLLYSDKELGEIGNDKNFSNYLFTLNWKGEFISKKVLSESVDKIFSNYNSSVYYFINSNHEEIFYRFDK